MTKSHGSRAIAVVISSTMPSAKYSCSGSPLILAKGRTAIDAPVDLARTGDGIHHARKLRQEAVGGFLYYPAPVLRNLGLDQFPQMRPKAFVRALLVLSHQP